MLDILTALVVVNLLPVLSSAQVGCSSGGESYAHLESFPHQNGCARLQCQNGSVVPIDDACGKELDRNCHKLGEQFIFRGETYVCEKTAEGEYHNDLAPPATFNCTAEGKLFKNLETFVLSDGCRTYQCHDGDVVVLNPEACGKELDGSCHFVNSWTSVNGKVYSCERTEIGDKVVYSYTELDPQPELKKCSLSSNKYSSLDYFRNRVDQCDIRQCQDGHMPFLTKVCRFRQDRGTCFPLSTRWSFKGRIFQCTEKAGSDERRVIRVAPKFRNCTVDTHTYQHLETFRSGDGCQTSQCQSGQVVVIHGACKDRFGQCHNLNFMWRSGTDTFKCIYQEPWGFTISRIFDVPVCETPGKDVIFVLDDSGSITAPNFEKQKEFSAQLTRRFYVGTNTSNAEYLFGTVIFSTDPYKLFDLKTHLDQNSLYQNLLDVKYSAGWTRTDKALDFIIDNNMFGPSSGGRDSAENFVVVVTDGQSNEPALTQQSAARLRNVATILSVGVGSGANDVELLGMAGDPDNVYRVENFDVLDKVQDKLSQKICKELR